MNKLITIDDAISIFDNFTGGFKSEKDLLNFRKMLEDVAISSAEPKIVPIANIHFDEDKMREICKEVAENIEVKQDWIPVSERLPEESLNSVIGWDAYRERCVFVQYINGHFQITGNNESFDIKAWMPLPSPYKGEQE